MAMAPLVYTLWERHLRFDPADPILPNRDRFVLSAGHASMLLYSMLHLTGVKAVDPRYEILGTPSVTLGPKRATPLGRRRRSRCLPPGSSARAARQFLTNGATMRAIAFDKLGKSPPLRDLLMLRTSPLEAHADFTTAGKLAIAVVP